MLASYLLSPLSKILNHEPTNDFKLVQDPNSNSINGLLMNKTKPVTLNDSLMTFRDTDKKLSLKGMEILWKW